MSLPPRPFRRPVITRGNLFTGHPSHAILRLAADFPPEHRFRPLNVLSSRIYTAHEMSHVRIYIYVYIITSEVDSAMETVDHIFFFFVFKSFKIIIFRVQNILNNIVSRRVPVMTDQ